MTARPDPGEPRLRWFEGVASPGPGGYAVAVLVSLVTLGVLSAAVEPFVAGGETVDPGGTFLGVVLVGAIFAVGLAPPGVLLVHLVTVRVRPQGVHVLVTGLVGAVAGWVVVRDAVPFVLMMGLATAVGRAAVVPLVPGVRRRRRQRERRRTALEGLAAQGVVDGYGAPHRRPGADFGPTPPTG